MATWRSLYSRTGLEAWWGRQTDGTGGNVDRHAVAVGGLATFAGLLGLAVAIGGPARQELTGLGADRVILPVSVVAAAVVPWIAVARPLWGLTAWIIAIPLFNLARLRLETSPVAITMASVIVIALGLGIAVARKRPALSPAERRAVGFTALIVALALCAVVVSADTGGSLAIVVHGVVEPAAVALVVVGLRPRSSRLVVLVVAVGVSTTIAALFSAYRLSHLVASISDAQALRTQFGDEIYYNVNIFGAVIVMALPLLVAGLVLRRRVQFGPRGTILLAALVAALLAALYLTFSKGAWLGGIVSLGFLLVWQSRTLSRRVAVGSATIALSLLIVPLPLYVLTFVASDCPAATETAAPGIRTSPAQPICGAIASYRGVVGSIQGSDRLNSWDPTTPSGEVSVRERFLAWRAAVNMIGANPLLGVGPGRYGVEAAGPFHDPTASRGLISAHNFLLNLAAEFGLPFGLMIASGLLAAIFIGIRLGRERDGPLSYIGVGVSSSLIGFVAVSTTSGIDLYQPYRIMNTDMVTLGLLLGVIAAGTRLMLPAAQLAPAAGRITAMQ